jgi:hypothetical protein
MPRGEGSGPVSPSDAVTEARGFVQARVEHDIECDYSTFIDGPCNCNRVAIVDALIAAVEARTLARVRGRIEGMRESHAAYCAADVMDVACCCDLALSERNRTLDTILRSLSASEDTTQGET